LSLSVARRAWNGVSVDISQFHCAGRVVHHLCYNSETRLSVLLEEIGSPCEPRLREEQPCPIGYMPRHMHFAPAGMEMWGYSADTRFVKDATLTFDLTCCASGWPSNSMPMRSPCRGCAFPTTASGPWSGCYPTW
jgi:hypothetical protein